MAELLKLTLSIYGLAILVSFLVAGLIRLIVLVQEHFRPAVAPPTPKPVPAPAPVEEGVPAHDLVAISAALAAVLKTHRIVHVRALHGRDWTAEGRAQHHTSHNLPRRPRR